MTTAVLAIGLVLATSLFIGVYGVRAARSTSDFLVASRRVSPNWNALAIAGEYLSAASVLGLAGLLLKNGLGTMWYAVGFTAGYVAVVALVAGPMRRSGAFTVPDFAEYRLGAPRLRKLCGCVVLVIMLLYLVPQFKGAGVVLSLVSGTPYWVGVLLAGLVVSGSIAAGGMRSADFLARYGGDELTLILHQADLVIFDNDGVLVLSELAGAASELGDAVLINAYDADATGAAIERALEMPRIERMRRVTRLRSQVMANDVEQWASAFIHRLCAPAASTGASSPGGRDRLASIVERASEAERVYILLDYDGTMVPIAEAPEQALPDRALIELLDDLCQCPGVEVHIVSGRPRESLDEWFRQLPIALWAEHGFWRRAPRSSNWKAAGQQSPGLLARVLPIVNQFTANTPGAWVETKTASLSWHYRQADPEFGERQAHELRMLLGDLLSNQPLEVVEGAKVVEIRFRGFSKALVALRTAFPPRSTVVAFGDDRSDEDLFRALPDHAITVSVGRSAPPAAFYVAGPDDVRALLRSITLTRRLRMAPLTSANG